MLLFWVQGEKNPFSSKTSLSLMPPISDVARLFRKKKFMLDEILKLKGFLKSCHFLESVAQCTLHFPQ